MQGLTGRTLGHYRVAEKIGAGGLGVRDVVMIMTMKLGVQPPTG